VLLLVGAFGAGLPGVHKDPSVDAFVPLDHPAAIARDEAREIFGLEDPVVVGLAVPRGQSAFTPPVLEALRRIHDGVRLVDEVKKNDVLSLASERAIFGEDGDLQVESLLEPGPVTEATAAVAWTRLSAMPMFFDLLASRAGDLVTLVIPVEDPNHAETVVAEIRALAEAEAPPGVTVHVAGVAAMNARLADTVGSDTRIFVPAAVVVVMLILLVALRRPLALLGPLVVIAGSALTAIGLMGWLDARYYLITTALPVVIMAIAVADSLHVTTFYLRARAAGSGARDAVLSALAHTWMPVTFTTVTTIAGFVGLSLGAAMQPISEFGLFAAVGVAAAWVLSLTALPAILVLTNLQPGAAQPGAARVGWVDRAVATVTRLALARPGLMLLGLGLWVTLLAVAASEARFDYERKRYFAPADAVRTADAELNTRLGGLNFLDLVIRAPEEGGILTPSVLGAMAELKAELAALPHVVKVTAIDDYIALMHRALNGGPEGVLPTAARAPAQYMFLYEASGAPEDFRHEIDYDYRYALVRAQLSTDRFAAVRPTVAGFADAAARWSARTGLDATLSGRVAVNDGWMGLLAANHFYGLGWAAGLVLLATLLAFRAVGPALLAMIPVCIGVLSVYATMGAFSIDIAPATSMTAAIATGLGVDFGIHLIAHVRRRLAAGDDLETAMGEQYVVVGRACYYSAIALAVALAVVCLSSAPPLRWFGLLVSAGALGSLVGALCILPCVLALTRSRSSVELQHA
jgi:predicted RND superfamily exporter protein